MLFSGARQYAPQVSIDVRSPSAGTLVEQMAGEGDTVEVGVALMKVDTSGAAAAPGECWLVSRGGRVFVLPSPNLRVIFSCTFPLSLYLHIIALKWVALHAGPSGTFFWFA